MDVNFFEPIKKKNKKKTNVAGLLLFATVTIVLTLVVVLYMFKRAEYKSLQNEIDSLEILMNSQSFQNQLNVVSEKEEELQAIKEGAAYLNNLASSIPSYHTVRGKIVDTLTNELTKTLYFEYLQITRDQLVLDGYATNVLDIAQFEYNLNHCGLFADVVVNTVKEEFATYILSGLEITQVTYEYKFSIQLTILEAKIERLK